MTGTNGGITRAAILAIGLTVAAPAAAEECKYSCPLVRWAAQNFSQATISNFIAGQSPGQVAACRIKCFASPATQPQRKR